MSSVDDLNWLPPQQRQLVIQSRHPSGQGAKFTMEEVGLTVGARIAKMVASYADRVAYATLAHNLTYAELDAASNQIARALLRQRRVAGPVAVMLDRARRPCCRDVALQRLYVAGHSTHFEHTEIKRLLAQVTNNGGIA